MHTSKHVTSASSNTLDSNVVAVVQVSFIQPCSCCHSEAREAKYSAFERHDVTCVCSRARSELTYLKTGEAVVRGEEKDVPIEAMDWRCTDPSVFVDFLRDLLFHLISNKRHCHISQDTQSSLCVNIEFTDHRR